MAIGCFGAARFLFSVTLFHVRFVIESHDFLLFSGAK